MIDLRPKIDQIIFDLRDSNYGLAESRLFEFLDDLNELQNECESLKNKLESLKKNSIRLACSDDPAAQYRRRYNILATDNTVKDK